MPDNKLTPQQAYNQLSTPENKEALDVLWGEIERLKMNNKQLYNAELDNTHLLAEIKELKRILFFTKESVECLPKSFGFSITHLKQINKALNK